MRHINYKVEKKSDGTFDLFEIWTDTPIFPIFGKPKTASIFTGMNIKTYEEVKAIRKFWDIARKNFE